MIGGDNLSLVGLAACGQYFFCGMWRQSCLVTRHETMQPWQKAGEAFIESMQESIKEICYFQGRNTQGDFFHWYPPNFSNKKTIANQ